MSQRDPGPIPNRWLNCPRKATDLIMGKFLAFKTPLGPQFNEKVPIENRFTPSILFSNLRDLKIKLGLWIDLTNTSRFYDKSEIERNGCKYIKMSCRGHGETPSKEQTRQFIKIVNDFMNQNPNDVIGVHCTHGFNRTGFLLVSYMVEESDCSLDVAIHEFARKRQPGIYKQDYLDELYRKYEDSADEVPTAPPRPQWCDEEYEDAEEDSPPPGNSNSSQSYDNSSYKRKRKGKHDRIKNKTFIPGVEGVTFFDTEPRLSEIQKKAQKFCKWEGKGFPGSQPVSMDLNNIKFLQDKPYRVSWKADGVRFMMLIDGEDEVYMLDRDNCAFKVKGLRFLHNKTMRHLKNTLLDGEMVIDHEAGREKHRYLCYDIIRFEDQNVGKESFYPIRLMCIEKEIINPRNRAIESGMIDKEKEPFSVHLKKFWGLSMTHCLLEEKFAKTLYHEPDGLIFQPSAEGYVPGPCEDVLKWKPKEMNSIDFRLKIVKEGGQGILPKKVGLLYVGRDQNQVAQIKLTKELKQLDNKIIECKFENNQWVFMRERTDKSYPNSAKTADAVFKSIMDPVTKEFLLDFINQHRFPDDSDVIPAKRPRH